MIHEESVLIKVSRIQADFGVGNADNELALSLVGKQPECYHLALNGLQRVTNLPRKHA